MRHPVGRGLFFGTILLMSLAACGGGRSAGRPSSGDAGANVAAADGGKNDRVDVAGSGAAGSRTPSNAGSAAISGMATPTELPVSRLIGGATLDPNAFWPPTGQDCSASLDPKGSIPSAPPQAFEDECAGCHGPDGSGHAGYPNLLVARPFDELQAIVRAGRIGSIGEMPAFKTSWLNDDDLRRIYAYLTKSPLLETQQCQPIAPMSDDEIADAKTRGLATWRTTDGKTDPNGIKSDVACAECHAPDPIDFAYFGFQDGDILRRGTQHLPAAKIADVIDMVHAFRAQYRIDRRDPMQVRPFQPGGALLPGHGIVERDAAFGDELTTMKLLIATEPIASAADADKAIDEVWAIDRHSLRIPVPFDRYSEDGFHNADGPAPTCDDDIDGCDDHGSIADWIPVAPHKAKDSASFYQAVDAYLAAPDDDNFAHLRYIAAQGDMPGTYDYGTKDLDDNKYRSLVLGNYCIRLELAGQAGCYDKGVTPFPNEAQPWDIGSQANLFGTGYAKYPDCDTKWTGCGDAPANLPQWPSHQLGDITPGATLSSNFSRLRHTWMTMWWTHFDPALLVTGDPTAQKDEYFTRSLFWSNDNDWKFDGSDPKTLRPTYGIFAAYEVLMHNVAVIENPQLASCKLWPATDFTCTAIDVRSGYYPDVNFAEQNQPDNPESSNNVHYQTMFMPTDVGRRAHYQLLVANLYRVFFWKLIGALQQDDWMCNPDLQTLRITRAKEFLAAAETQQANGAQDDAMFSKLSALMSSARMSCPPLTAGMP
jgi:mono/diheme cytochrome c family protein